MTTVLWRCLYTPGHDACGLERTDSGWQLDGTAVFRHEGGSPVRLAYRLSCDLTWRTREGRVEGWVGTQAIRLDIVREDGGWLVNGAAVPGVERCVDLDFGFTPATNLPQLRRLNLATGESAELDVAWIDVDGRLQPLPQVYERRSETTYWYQSPTVGYAALLEVAPGGFVRLYPDLWEAEP